MDANHSEWPSIPDRRRVSHPERAGAHTEERRRAGAPTSPRHDVLPIAPDCHHLEAEVAQLKRTNALLEDSANVFGALAERLNQRPRT
jgi:hypothetical protein